MGRPARICQERASVPMLSSYSPDSFEAQSRPSTVRAADGVERRSATAYRISDTVAIAHLQVSQTTKPSGGQVTALPHRGQWMMVFCMSPPTHVANEAECNAISQAQVAGAIG